MYLSTQFYLLHLHVNNNFKIYSPFFIPFNLFLEVTECLSTTVSVILGIKFSKFLKIHWKMEKAFSVVGRVSNRKRSWFRRKLCRDVFCQTEETLLKISKHNLFSLWFHDFIKFIPWTYLEFAVFSVCSTQFYLLHSDLYIKYVHILV